MSSHVIDDGANRFNHLTESWIGTHFVAEFACLITALLSGHWIEIDLHSFLVLHLSSVRNALAGESVTWLEETN